jgi:DNA processing protein
MLKVKKNTSFEIKEVKISDSSYPKLLREIKSPPSSLYYMGELIKSDELAIAIVGTRKASYDGLILARKVSADLAKRGFVIVSGLAIGIDTASHLGALDVSSKTIAVLGSGLNNIYPPSNYNLAFSILEKKGCLLSQYLPDEPPLPYKFLERNRIISGLAIATIIIEAPKKSGALNTARFAYEEGREVFVFPGDINNKNYEGSNLLIRNGARLVTKSSDILEDLMPVLKNYGFTLPYPEEKKEALEEKEVLILQALSKDEFISIDKLAEITNLEIQEVNEKITNLFICGKIEEKNGQYKLKN